MTYAGGLMLPSATAMALDPACIALMNSMGSGNSLGGPNPLAASIGSANQTPGSGSINYPVGVNPPAALMAPAVPSVNAGQSAVMMIQAIMGMVQGGVAGASGGSCAECSAVPCTCNTAPVDMRPMVPATAPAVATAPIGTPAVAAPVAAQPNLMAQLKAQLNPTNNAQINQMIDMSSQDADVMKLMIAAANDGTKIKFGDTSANVNGFYQPGDRTITLGNKLAGKNGALDTFIHELGHAATRGDGNSLNEEARNEAFATVKADQLLGRATPNANKIFTDTVALYKRTAGQSNLGQDNNAARAFAALGINLGNVGLNALG
jgi:hypothetical protein